MKCKFCGCTEQAGCSIPVRELEDGSQYVEMGVIEQLAIDIEYFPCTWLLPDVCSAPACVEKAYAEALPLALTIQRALDLGLIEEAA